MSKLDGKWNNGTTARIGKKLRETISPPGPLKPRIEYAVHQIETHVSKLDITLTKLKDKDASLFESIGSALNSHDTDASHVISNELAEVRKASKMVSQAKLALSQVALRLTTIKELGDVTVTLAPAVKVIRSVKSGLASAMPQDEFSDVNKNLSGLLDDFGKLSGFELNFQPASEESEKILSEAAAVAAQKINEKFSLPSKNSDENVGIDDQL